MLGLLFEDGEVLGSDSVSVREKGPEPPPRVRAPCGLSGINNQGATCYLNSLIQTLVYTPEFRGIIYVYFLSFSGLDTVILFSVSLSCLGG